MKRRRVEDDLLLLGRQELVAIVKVLTEQYTRLNAHINVYNVRGIFITVLLMSHVTTIWTPYTSTMPSARQSNERCVASIHEYREVVSKVLKSSLIRNWRRSVTGNVTLFRGRFTASGKTRIKPCTSPMWQGFWCRHTWKQNKKKYKKIPVKA